MTYVVVGAGFTGATIAERLAAAGQAVHVFERRLRVGGSAEDYRANDGLLVQKYGPHVFHTNSDRVWQYVQQFGEWRPIKYRVAASVDGVLVPLPLDFRAVRTCFELFAEANLERMTAEYGLGTRVTLTQLRKSFPAFADWAVDRVFRGYSEKHWGMPLEEVPASVLARLPFVVGEQESYFTDKFQAVPVNGYTALIERMLDHPNITVDCGVHAGVALSELTHSSSNVVWTGSPDAFFGEEGALPYRSVVFGRASGGDPAFFRNKDFATITMPSKDVAATRVTSMCLHSGLPLAPHQHEDILITDVPKAYAPGTNDPFYPIPLEANIRRAQEYAARRPPNVWFAGRLGSYQYLNMDQAIAQALALFERIRDA